MIAVEARRPPTLPAVLDTGMNRNRRCSAHSEPSSSSSPIEPNTDRGEKNDGEP